MRHRAIATTALVLVFGGTALLSLYGKFSSDQHNVIGKPTDSSMKQPSNKTSAPDTPQYIRIPKLGLQATIQAVGLNKQGNMASPDKLTDTAWYKPGVRPGEVGNAVIAGHYGKPHQAAFWNLNQLEKGDIIEIVDVSKQTLTFVVTSTERVSPDKAQRQRIFGPSVARHLNLITCDGAWDAKTRSYDLRFIVYTTLHQQ